MSEDLSPVAKPSPDDAERVDVKELAREIQKFLDKNHKRDLETLRLYAGLAEKDAWRRFWIAVLLIACLAALATFMVFSGMEEKLGYVIAVVAALVPNVLGSPSKRPQPPPE